MTGSGSSVLFTTKSGMSTITVVFSVQPVEDQSQAFSRRRTLGQIQKPYDLERDVMARMRPLQSVGVERLTFVITRRLELGKIRILLRAGLLLGTVALQVCRIKRAKVLERQERFLPRFVSFSQVFVKTPLIMAER